MHCMARLPSTAHWMMECSTCPFQRSPRWLRVKTPGSWFCQFLAQNWWKDWADGACESVELFHCVFFNWDPTFKGVSGVLQPEIPMIKRYIHAFGKMKCRKLPTPFSWDCDLDQGSSTQSPHKKHARTFKKNSQQGEIGWNGIKPSWDSDFQCIFNWKNEPFVELSQRC